MNELRRNNVRLFLYTRLPLVARVGGAGGRAGKGKKEGVFIRK